jgi:regulatory protein
LKRKQTITAKEAMVKAQSLCAGQEKCKSDIRKKLFDWKVPQKDHDQVINQLEEDQFIDEIRYARFFAKDKLKYNKWGKIKIAYTLKQKDIPEDYIQTALEEIEESDYDEILKNELLKKLKSIKDTDEFIIKSKLMRFAASRGFESGKIFDMVSKIMENAKN